MKVYRTISNALTVLASATIALAENPSPVIPGPPAAVHHELARAPTSSGLTQPISHPAPGEKVVLGSTFKIQWKPTTGTKVTIQVWANEGIGDIWGKTCDHYIINTECSQIASGVENSGSFDWHVPYFDCWTAASAADTWYIKIYVLDFDTEPVISFSEDFHIMSQSQADGGDMQCALFSTLFPSSPPSKSTVHNVPSSTPPPATQSKPIPVSSSNVSPPSTPGFSSGSTETLFLPGTSNSDSSRVRSTPATSRSFLSSSAISNITPRTTGTATTSSATATSSGAASAHNFPWENSVLFSLIFGIFI